MTEQIIAYCPDITERKGELPLTQTTLLRLNPDGVGAEPGKQKTRSCRTQEWPEAVQKNGAEKGWPTEPGRSFRRTNLQPRPGTQEGVAAPSSPPLSC
jgi:hypothetical protein